MSNGHFTKLRVHLTSFDWLKVDFWKQGPVAADTLHSGTILDQSESRIQDVMNIGHVSFRWTCITLHSVVLLVVRCESHLVVY